VALGKALGVQTHQRLSVAEAGAFYAASLVAPEIPERLGGKRRVADRVPNVLMTQIVLDRACIVPITGELVAVAVPLVVVLSG
jgi:hypothetical protein